MLKLILVAIILIGIAFGGIAIRMFFIKGGNFKKSCSSIDPNTGKKLGCTCGDNEDTMCNNT